KRLAAGVGPQSVKLWDAETGREAATLLAPGWQGHVFQVCRTAFSRDGKSLASGCVKGYVRVWGLPAGQVWPAGDQHFPRLLHLQATAEGRRLVFAAGPERVVRARDAATGQELFSLAGHAGKVLALAVSPDEKRIATGGEDQAVKVWDV